MGFFDDPFGISSMIQAGASLVTQQRDQKFQGRETALANERAKQNEREARDWNAKQATVGNNRNRANMGLADRLADDNARVANEYSSAEAEKSRDFNAAQADKANAFTNSQALRNRQWANTDYNRQKLDQADQFVNMRAAAEKAGLNPLTAMGMGSFVPTPASGQSSSSYAAAVSSGPMATMSSPMSVSGASVPMTYGAPVQVQPLVSSDAILGAVGELGQELTGANAVQRANDQLYADLARVELEQALRPAVDSRAPSLGPASMRPPVVPISADSVGSNSLDGFNSGFAPTYSRNPDDFALFGTETRPETLGTGMSQVSNAWLPEFGGGPYNVMGDLDEAFQLENLPVNAAVIGMQMAERGASASRAWWQDGSPTAAPANSGSVVREYIPGSFNGTRLQGGYGGH